MEIVRKDKTVKFKQLAGNVVFLAHGNVPYLKLNSPVVLKEEPDYSFTAVQIGGIAALAAITPDTECIVIKGRFVEDAR